MSYLRNSLLLFLCCQFLLFSTNALINCTVARPCNQRSIGCSVDSDDCTLQCYGPSSCDGTIFNCNTNTYEKRCQMFCHGANSCENAKFISTNPQSNILECNNDNACQQLTMTSAGSTTIQCNGISACKRLDLTITSTSGALNAITCHDFPGSCEDTKISINGPFTSSSLSCMGTEAACTSTVFNCTDTTGDCNVNCTRFEACETSQLICGGNTCTSNQNDIFEVIGGIVIPTDAPSMAPTIPAVLQNYAFIDNATDWFSAQQHCQTVYESNLATIVNTADFDNINIYSNVSSNRWIGLNNYYQNMWQWVDGSNCDYVGNNTGMCKDDKHWAVNQPTDVNNTCGVMSAQYNGMYTNVDCMEQHSFICQLTKRLAFICAKDMDLALRRVFESIAYDEYISNRTAYNDGFLKLYILDNYWYLIDDNNNTLATCYINGTQFVLPTECVDWQWMSAINSNVNLTNLTFSDCLFSGICMGDGLDPKDYETSGWDIIFRQYEFQYFDFQQNGPVYYSPGNKLYAYPLTTQELVENITTTINRYIVNNETIDIIDLKTVEAFCVIDNNVYYVYDILDCDTQWIKYNHDQTDSVFDPLRQVKSKSNCNPTPYPTAAPTLTPEVIYMRFYCYYASQDPFEDSFFNVTEFVNVFTNVTLSAMKVGFDAIIYGSIEDFKICEVFVNFDDLPNITSVLGPNNCPFVTDPALIEPPEGPYYAAANFKVYASSNNLEVFTKNVILAFHKTDFWTVFYDHLRLTKYDYLNFEVQTNGIYVFNTVTESPTTAIPTVIPTQSPTKNPISIRDLILKILHTLKNWKSWKELRYQLFADYLRNATLETFYELYISDDNDITAFDICAVFNDELVNEASDECPYDDQDYDDEEETEQEFSSVAPFRMQYIGTFNPFKSDIRNIFEGIEFKDKLEVKMNELLSSSVSSRRLLVTDFSVVTIEIIDPENTTTSSTRFEDSMERGDEEDDGWLDTLFLMAFIVIISIFIIVIIVAYIFANCIWVNHYFRVSALFTVAVHCLDMLSDVFFTIHASFDRGDFKILMIFILSACFIFLPIIITIIQLWKHMKKHWLSDDKLRSWLSENTALLYFVSIVTGSSFTAIELFNSNLFGLPQFDMGLSRTELMGYQYKRVYSIVLLENIPQLGLQASYIYATGGIWDVITATSLAFTIISIVVHIITMFVQKGILFDQDLVMIEFHVTGSSVVAKGDQCRNIIRSLHEQLSTTLGLHKGLVEIVRPNNIPNGLKIHLNIHIRNDEKIENTNDVCKEFENRAIKAINCGQIQTSLMDCWKLDSAPFVSNLSVTTKESKKRERMYTVNEGPNTEMIETQIVNHDINDGEGIRSGFVEGIGNASVSLIPPGTVEKKIVSISELNHERMDLNEYGNNNVNRVGSPPDAIEMDDIIANVNTIGGPNEDGDRDQSIIAGVNTMGGPNEEEQKGNGIDNDIIADVNTLGGPMSYKD